MTTRLLPEVLVLSADSPQAQLPLAPEGVLRYVWQHQFGSMLIEVKGGRAFIDGNLVIPADLAGGRLTTDHEL